MQKLPLNAQAFFTANKPQTYIYHPRDIPNSGVVMGMEQPGKGHLAHTLPPNQQPRAALKAPVVSPPRLVQPAQHYRTPAQAIRAAHNPTPVQRPPTPPPSRCKYQIKSVNPSCGCGSFECQNPECPLSRVLPSGKRASIQPRNCGKANCRWFEE